MILTMSRLNDFTKQLKNFLFFYVSWAAERGSGQSQKMLRSKVGPQVSDFFFLIHGVLPKVEEFFGNASKVITKVVYARMGISLSPFFHLLPPLYPFLSLSRLI